MTTVVLLNEPADRIPPLMAGDRLTRDEFERRYHAMPVHILLTKADKLTYGAAKNVLLQVRRTLSDMPDLGVQLFSATKRLGVDECRERIAAWLGLT